MGAGHALALDHDLSSVRVCVLTAPLQMLVKEKLRGGHLLVVLASTDHLGHFQLTLKRRKNNNLEFERD